LWDLRSIYLDAVTANLTFAQIPLIGYVLTIDRPPTAESVPADRSISTILFGIQEAVLEILLNPLGWPESIDGSDGIVTSSEAGN
jgi:hypothetical protein